MITVSLGVHKRRFFSNLLLTLAMIFSTPSITNGQGLPTQASSSFNSGPPMLTVLWGDTVPVEFASPVSAKVRSRQVPVVLKAIGPISRQSSNYSQNLGQFCLFGRVCAVDITGEMAGRQWYCPLWEV